MVCLGVSDVTVGQDEPVRHVGICSSVCAEGRPGPCSPNRDKHGRRVAASHGYPNWITHVHSVRVALESGSIVSSSHRLAKEKKMFWFTGQTSSCWIGMRVAQEGTGVPIYIPLRWIFLYHSSYHCTEWVRKQWNQKTKQNKGNCQSAQPYRFGSDETCTGSGSRVWMGKGAYARFIRKKERKTICWNYPK